MESSFNECNCLLYFTIHDHLNSGKNSALSIAVGKDWKGKLSPVLYVIGISTAFVNEWISGGLYIIVALIWLIPDKRIENAIEK